jgi:hypothetical protein
MELDPLGALPHLHLLAPAKAVRRDRLDPVPTGRTGPKGKQHYDNTHVSS